LGAVVTLSVQSSSRDDGQSFLIPVLAVSMASMGVTSVGSTFDCGMRTFVGC